MSSHFLQRLRLLAVCLGLFAVQPVRAWADQSEPGGAPPPKFLLLGFYEGPNLSPPLREEAATVILDKKLGLALLPLLGNGDQELACLKPSCLEVLAGRFQDADYLIGGAIYEDRPNRRHEVQVWIFKSKPTDEEKQNKQRQVWNKEYCNDCDDKPGARVDKLGLLVEKLIRDWILEKPQAFVPPDIGKEKTKRSCWNFKRSLTMGAGTGLAVAGLASGISVISLAGPSIDLQGSDGTTFTEIDATPWRSYSAPGFVALALGAAGIVTALAGEKLFTGPDGVCETQPPGRWTGPRGAALGVFGSLLLSGLAAAIPLSVAQHRITCLEKGDMRVQHTCDWGKNMGIAWGFSGAALIGLTISLAWPAGSGAP